MNSNHNTDYSGEMPEDKDVADSVDDFIRQLEEREKALDISSDLVIEVGESEFDERKMPEFLLPEMLSAPPAPPVQPPEKFTSNRFPAKEQTAIAADGAARAALEDEITVLRAQIAKMEDERAEIFENSRRRSKDFETFKSRTERERNEIQIAQISSLATQMLPVLDNMNRALDFAVRVPDAKTSDFRQFFDGIVLVNNQLNEIITAMGIEAIPAVGEVFDPYFHEAVAADSDARLPANTISGELLRGYRIGDKVIRASMVKVVTNSQNTRSAAPSSGGDANDTLIEL